MKHLTLRAIVHDAFLSLMAGIVLAGGLSLLMFLVGLLAHGFDPLGALVTVRGGLLIAGSLELFVFAGLLLFNKDSRKVRDYGQWARHFQSFGLIPVLVITSVVVLTAGSLVDYYLYF